MIQALLGHKNLATTQIYTHADREDLEKAVNLIMRKRETGQEAIVFLKW